MAKMAKAKAQKMTKRKLNRRPTDRTTLRCPQEKVVLSLVQPFFYFFSLNNHRNMLEEDIRRALQILVQAPDNALLAVRTELLAALIGLKKRIRLSTDECIETLDSLLAKADEIKKKQADVASVIGEISSSEADIRLQHIYPVQPGGKGFKCRVRAIFAYRSLGFEFDEYTESQYGKSRVTELAADFRKADERSSGHIQEFLREKGLANDGPNQKAVGFAIKMLVLEKSSGNCGISWLVSFISSKIRNLSYQCLADICHLLSQRDGDYSTLGELASSFSNLIRTGQRQYDGEFSYTLEDTILIYRLVQQSLARTGLILIETRTDQSA